MKLVIYAIIFLISSIIFSILDYKLSGYETVHEYWYCDFDISYILIISIFWPASFVVFGVLFWFDPVVKSIVHILGDKKDEK